MKLLSIVVPVYNSEETIKKCLNSIYRQSLQDFELILIDDFSIDDSLTIIEQYAQKYDNIKIIRNKKRLGSGQCRNIGIEQATGYFIAFVDSDDYLINKHSYEFMIKESIKHNVPVASSNIQFNTINGVKNETQYYQNIMKTQVYDSKKYELPHFIQKNIFKKDFIDENNLKFSDLSKGEDNLFMAQVLLQIKKFVNVNIKSYAYNVPDYTNVMSFENYRDLLCSYQKICEFYSKNNKLDYLDLFLKEFLELKEIKVDIHSKKQLKNIDNILFNIYKLLNSNKQLNSEEIKSFKDSVNKEFKINNSKKLSIIIYANNTLNELNNCLNSFLYQDFEDVEIICVSDITKENFVNSIHRLINKNKKSDIKLIFNNNYEGRRKSFIKGYQESLGKNILFVTANSWFDYDSIENFLKISEKQADLMVFKKVNDIEKITYNTSILNEFDNNVIKSNDITEKEFFNILNEDINLVISKQFLDKLLKNYSDNIFNNPNVFNFLSLYNAKTFLINNQYLENITTYPNHDLLNSISNLEILFKIYKRSYDEGFDKYFLNYIVELYKNIYESYTTNELIKNILKNSFNDYNSKYDLEYELDKHLNSENKEFIEKLVN